MAVAAVAALVVIATPKITAVWSVVWGLWDFATGGLEHRQELLVERPFPPSLAPSGYRLTRVEPFIDEEGTLLSVDVSFAGPDDENSIGFYPQAMIAPETYDYWRRGDDVLGLRPVAVDGLGSNSFCHEGEVFEETHGVSCVAAFDGMAVIAESANKKPGRGNVRHAVTLLRAGVAHWESIRD